jgi:hypothetical protein
VVRNDLAFEGFVADCAWGCVGVVGEAIGMGIVGWRGWMWNRKGFDPIEIPMNCRPGEGRGWSKVMLEEEE